MNILPTALPDLFIVEPALYQDARGFFLESYNRRQFAEAARTDPEFVQDNHSKSVKGVLRGLHYQTRKVQGKLVRVISGAVYDVAVDLRKNSSTFGQWAGVELSENNRRMLWIPEGFAHGFLVLSDSADVLYKTTDYYAPEYEGCIRWDDPDVAIRWPLEGQPIVSAKDARGSSLRQAQGFDEADYCN